MKVDGMSILFNLFDKNYMVKRAFLCPYGRLLEVLENFNHFSHATDISSNFSSSIGLILC